ncbi:MAG: hypothetical protein K0Q70_2681 [Rhodospirillales bacterium]|jgi:hypothetical protein|nr:hypothetical protein [Rhodospirillales bacterium]
MSSVLEIQSAFADALLHGGVASPSLSIANDRIAAETRIDIHRNNVRASLGEALGEMFPLIRRLVGDGFFAFAAHEFVCAHPPASPCVADYGDGLADFLSGFAPCRDHPYLPDVTRFERLLHNAARRPDMAALDASALAPIDAADAGHLVFELQPDRGYLRSPWPLIAIWRANQDGGDGTIGPQANGVLIEVCRRDGIVEFRELLPQVFAFRAALAAGTAFGDALEAVSDRNGSFDAAAALMELFADRAVTGIRLME